MARGLTNATPTGGESGLRLIAEDTRPGSLPTTETVTLPQAAKFVLFAEYEGTSNIAEQGTLLPGGPAIGDFSLSEDGVTLTIALARGFNTMYQAYG